MKRNILFIALGLLVVALLYFFGETRPETARSSNPSTVQGPAPMVFESAIPKGNFDAFTDVEERLNPADSAWFYSKAYALTDTLAPSEENTALLMELAQFGASNGFGGVLVLAEQQLAKQNKAAEDWNQAGLTAYAIGERAQNSDARSWFLHQAEKSFQKALALKPDDADLQVNLARCYLQTEQTTMTGITGLLDVVKENPEHIEAQLLLARYGLLSSQFDKVLARTEKVLSLQPENGEAWLLRAEAQQGLGNTEEAINSLEESLNHISDSVLVNEINRLLNRLQ